MLALRTTRRLAPVAARCMSSVDLSSVSNYVKTPEARAELEGFLRAMNDMSKRIEGAPAKKEIDWAHWEKTIRWPGLVASFKQAAGNVKVTPLQDTFTPELKKTFGEAVSALKASAEKSNARVAELDALLAEIDARPSGRQLTIEEAYKSKPEVAKQIEQDIKDNKWFL